MNKNEFDLNEENEESAKSHKEKFEDFLNEIIESPDKEIREFAEAMYKFNNGEIKQEDAKLVLDMYDKYVLGSNWQERLKVNEKQMEKYFRAIKFFRKLADNFDGRIDTTSPKLSTLDGCITAIFDFGFSIYPEDMPEFSKIMGDCSCFEITPRTDESVMVNCLVRGIYEIEPEGDSQ